MSFFNNLENKINQAGQTITNKASSIADSSKLNYQISAEERALADLYRQLGSTYYSYLGENPDERLKPLCESIGRKVEQIASLRQQDAAAKGKCLCPGCGSECDVFQPFCYVCHRELTPAAPTTPLCPTCGQALIPGASFCTVCGTRVQTP